MVVKAPATNVTGMSHKFHLIGRPALPRIDGDDMTAKKVLVVDDESSIREMLRLALEIADFECVEARDIHEAYRIITDDTPDIVLLDWMLP